MYGRIHFSVTVHLAKAPFTASSENMPDSKSAAYRVKYKDMFQQNVLSAHI